MCPTVQGRQNVFRSEVMASHCHCCEESKNQELHNRQLSDDNAAFVDSFRCLFATLPKKLMLEKWLLCPLQVQYNGHASPGVSDTSGLFSVIEDQFYKVYINYQTNQGS